MLHLAAHIKAARAAGCRTIGRSLGACRVLFAKQSLRNDRNLRWRARAWRRGHRTKEQGRSAGVMRSPTSEET